MRQACPHHTPWQRTEPTTGARPLIGFPLSTAQLLAQDGCRISESSTRCNGDPSELTTSLKMVMAERQTTHRPF